ncbi:MAG: hypothetical protein JEZ02_08350 [Desulfatibacillum sp.]|nr:hypothetical protein [Desulfatibacillum sp.]
MMTKRPLPITIIVFVFFAEGLLRFGGAIALLLISFGDIVLAQFQMFSFVMVSFANLVACFGLWKLRQWGVLLFIGVWLFNFFYALILEGGPIGLTKSPWDCFMFLISPVLFAIVILPYWKRFNN